MMELYLGSDESQFPALFEKMYRQRFEIYVRRRKWKDLKPLGELEKDEYDTSSAVYLLVLDDEDEILAGLRLLPTVGPHILGDLFPHLAAGGVPTAPSVMELTRFYVAPFKASKSVRDWLVGVLCAGLIEYCLASGIERVTSVIDTFLLKLMLSMEWKVRPLGIPARYPEGEAVAVSVDMTLSILQSTRRTKQVSGPVLLARPKPLARVPSTVRLSGAEIPQSLIF
jgi:acyl-homoserine lactone synthase